MQPDAAADSSTNASAYVRQGQSTFDNLDHEINHTQPVQTTRGPHEDDTKDWMPGTAPQRFISNESVTDAESFYDLSQDQEERASGSSTRSPTSICASTDRGHSLASMFEEFLNRQGAQHEGVFEKCGVVFLGQSSPFTFALEELQKGKRPDLHDTGFGFPFLPKKPEDPKAAECNEVHGSHMSVQDINYLCTKGAFTYPKPEVLKMLFDAFSTRFHPLYSIVNIKELAKTHQQQKLPWLLLHTVCLIGATFCDQNIVHCAGFKSRWHARRAFYNKAKVLFDLGYETNKIILLQAVLMLSFWGPQMKSYWNPCSWVGFAVTIAESLGIQRAASSAHLADTDHRGLLRRLWWTVVRRDAYCAALLGRPFRINMSQCDTPMLILEDFDDTTSYSANHDRALFQIHSAKLSLVLRHIVQHRFGPTNASMTVQHLHNMLQQWQADLPAAVDWRKQARTTDIFSTSLKIIFYHHLIFIHLSKPLSETGDMPLSDQLDGLTPPKVAETAARMISSTAFGLMMHSMVGKMPHEVFPGFFVAGIVFYRQLQQPQNLLASLGRSALDNCQLVMNEAKERWDASQWVLRIFEFLLLETQQAEANESEQEAAIILSEPDLLEPNACASQPSHVQAVPQATGRNLDHLDMSNTTSNNILHSVDIESPQNHSLRLNEFLVMPNYFVSTADEGFRLDF